MRKKKQEELKREIKKEVIKEIRNESLKEISVPKPIKPPVLEHSKEELEEIRKNFLKVFLIAIALLFAIIVILIFDPFSNKKDDIVQEIPNIEEDVEDDSLINREDGIIENTNIEMLNMFYELVPNLEEYLVYDSTYLYSKDELLVEEIPDNYLLNLMAKSTEFKSLIDNTGLITKAEFCWKDGMVRIPVEEIDIVMKNLFNRSNVSYENFTYTHYVDYKYSTYIKFVYSDGYYVSFCDNELINISYNSIAKPVIKEAKKEENTLTISTKVVFMTKDKVYADYGLTKVLSNNLNTDVLNYIDEADEYLIIFERIDNRYVFDKIMKKNLK